MLRPSPRWLVTTLAMAFMVPASLGHSPNVHPHAGSWSLAHEVPGSATLNFGGVVKRGAAELPSVNAIDCPAAGSCSAGGYYSDRGGNAQAFLVNEVNGKWQRMQEVPGSKALNLGGRAEINTISCSSLGNCSAGGDYTSRTGAVEAMVINEIRGVWRRAIELPNIGVLNGGGNASMVSLSCRSNGNCSAGGYFADRVGYQAFIVTEVAGVWRSANEVPRTAFLNVGDNAQVRSVSCASPGNCSAGGYYANAKSQFGAFVVNETKGGWGQAQVVPNTTRLNSGHLGGLTAISCAAVGDCSAVGSYLTSKQVNGSFLVVESKGKWGAANPLPTKYRVNANGQVVASSITCPLADGCTVTGEYWDQSGHWQVFAATEHNGVWQPGTEILGTAKFNGGGNGQVNSLACGAAGYCMAVGFITTTRGSQETFASIESNFSWHGAQILPGTQRLNAGGLAEGGAVSCTVSGFCAAGGDYQQRGGGQELFVSDFRP